MRYGSQAYFPCCRCTVSQGELGLLVLGSEVIPRRVEDLQKAYESLMTIKTKQDREAYLKEHGLRLPKSALLERFEFSLDVENIQRAFRSNNSNWRGSPPFGLPGLIRFESPHNFDLGITADLLRGIGKYFAMTLTPTAANSIVATANAHQSMLPHRSDTRSFRLPSPGSTIAESHANVNATQYRSALCVLPFLLCGATKQLSNLEAEEAILALLEYVFAYLNVHHYARRINRLPYYQYELIKNEFHGLLNTYDETYRSSIGKTRTQTGIQGALEDGQCAQTLKSNQLLIHLSNDMKSGGLVSNYDAQAGEFHHVNTRSHFTPTSRRAEAESKVETRSTSREIGAFEGMYPLTDPATDPADLYNQSQDASDEVQNQRLQLRYPQSDQSDCDDDECDINTETHPENTNQLAGESQWRRLRQKRRRLKGKAIKVCPETTEGLSEVDFHRLVQNTVPTNLGYRYIPRASYSRTIQTIRIQATYPWIPESPDKEFVLNSLKGTTHLIRVARSFYTDEPQFDFVQYQSGEDHEMGQVRLLFYDPNAQLTGEQERALALIRVLTPSQDAHHGNAVSQSPLEKDWNAEIVSLFARNKCEHLKLATQTDGSPLHVDVSVDSFLRPVFIVPDFQSPVGMEVGSKRWSEATTRDVERDKKRYQKEQSKKNRLDNIRLARKFFEGPVDLPAISDERFFHNSYMPWTTPII